MRPVTPFEAHPTNGALIFRMHAERHYSSLSQLFRQRIITDVLNHFLAFVTANPIQILGDLALIEVGIHIDKQETPYRIRRVGDIFLGGGNA